MNMFKQFSGVVAGVAIVAVLVGVPAVSQAQSGNSAQIERLQKQVEQLQQRIQQLQNRGSLSEDDNATSSEQERGAGNRPDTAGPPSFGDRLPEQASDRAHQVMQCLELGRILRQGDAGTTVQQVQESLKEQGYFDYPEATGYFGPITEEAVKKFQQAKGIVDSGSPETTGFGQIGPRTQAALAQATCLRETAPSDGDDDNDTATSTDNGTEDTENGDDEEEEDNENATSTDTGTDE
ncbi:MAG: peptidoglycan-binding domain-containing protein [Candidatus Paceibacterota bacterium]